LTLPASTHHFEVYITFPMQMGISFIGNHHNLGISTFVGLKTDVAYDTH